MGVVYWAFVERLPPTSSNVARIHGDSDWRLEAFFDLGKAYTTSAAMNTAHCTAKGGTARLWRDIARELQLSEATTALLAVLVEPGEGFRGDATPAEFLAAWDAQAADARIDGHDPEESLRLTERAMLAWLRQQVKHEAVQGGPPGHYMTRFRLVLFADS